MAARIRVGRRRVALVALSVALTGAAVHGVDVASAGADVPIPALPAPPGSEDDFYRPPSPLPAGRPGDVIRTRLLPISLYPGAEVRQIMYLSTDNQGEPIAVTGALLTPRERAASSANPLVVHTPGARGLADHCAPSRQANLAQANPASLEYSGLEYQKLLDAGISVVVTDYQGQGTPGLPSFFVGRPSGQAGLDALRAAQRIEGTGISRRSPLGIAGYSQGGHAAAWAAQLARTYAPELDIRGVLTGGVLTDVLATVRHIDGNPTAGVGIALASLVGLDRAFPELKLSSLATPDGQQILDRIEQSCYPELLTTFGTTTVADVTKPDVLTLGTWQNRYRNSLAGLTAPAFPAYVHHGTADTIVPYEQGQLLYRSWCERGATVTFESQPGLDHLLAGTLGRRHGLDWLIAQLDRADQQTGCREVGPV